MADSSSNGEGSYATTTTGFLTPAETSSALTQTAFSRRLITVLLKHWLNVITACYQYRHTV